MSDDPKTTPDPPEEPPPEPKVWSRGPFTVVFVLALAFLTVQFAVPLSPVVLHPSEVRTDFSWDMFAVRRDCRECYLLHQRRGQAATRYKWIRLYNTTFQAARTRNKQRLPLAAREVCRREAAAGRPDTQVFVVCNCQYNRGEMLNLDPFGGDYCSAKAAELYDP